MRNAEYWRLSSDGYPTLEQAEARGDGWDNGVKEISTWMQRGSVQ
jgi:hypothetical protein